MRRTPVVLAIVLFFALAAHANSVPILTASQGTMTVNALFSDVVGTVFYTFSGNGFSFAGFGTVGFDPYVVQGAPAGFGPLTASGGSVFGECCGSLQIGNSSFFNIVAGGISITGPNFNLPSTNQSSFVVTLPVIFSGAFSPCQFDISLQACPSGPVAFINVNGKGTVQLTYTNNGGLWTWQQAVFTLSPAPEPSSILLLGTGAVALAFRFVRRRM